MGTSGYDLSYLIHLSLKIILKIQNKIKYIKEDFLMLNDICMLHVMCLHWAAELDKGALIYVVNFLI